LGLSIDFKADLVMHLIYRLILEAYYSVEIWLSKSLAAEYFDDAYLVA
jgi:hypothetical protein